MSARSRLKYQQAQKQGFKPRIPDAPEEEMFVDTFESSLESVNNEETAPQIYPRKPSLPFDESVESVAEPSTDLESEEKPKIGRKNPLSTVFSVLKFSAFLAVCRKIGSFFAKGFHFGRRISASAFERVKSFQKSYLESITAEGGKQGNENETIPPPEIPETVQKEDSHPTVALTSEQIETTSRQLAELQHNPKQQSTFKGSVAPSKTVEEEEEIVEEEELFDEDDFDAAVRRARLKLVAAAALVFFSLGGFLAYQFLASQSAKPDAVAANAETENPKSATENLEVAPPFLPMPQSRSISQLATVNPPIAQKVEPAEESIPGFDAAIEDFSVASTPITTPTAEEPDFVDPLDAALNGSTQSEGTVATSAPQFDAFAPVETEIADASDSPEVDLSFHDLAEETGPPEHIEPPPTMNAGLPGQSPSTLSLQASEKSQPPMQTDSRQVLQGETQGVKITIPNSPAGNLPLPRASSLAEGSRSAPAAPFASRFKEEEPIPGVVDDELSGPTLARPNRRYEADANLAGPRIDETAIHAAQDSIAKSEAKPLFTDSRALNKSTKSSRTKSLPFDASRSRPQILAEAGAYPETSPSTLPTNFVKNNWQSRQVEYRKYIVQEGDNLFNIAKRELGKVTRWNEIKQLNKDTLGQNAEYLTPGVEILLPE